jgi:hypothetical protein
MRTLLRQWSAKRLPIWRAITLLLLTPIVMPISIAIVLLILLPVCVWNTVVWCIYWLRWRVLGIPIPPHGPDA